MIVSDISWSFSKSSKLFCLGSKGGLPIITKLSQIVLLDKIAVSDDLLKEILFEI